MRDSSEVICNISIEVVRLNQMLWNALLFTGKTGVTEGSALFRVRDGVLKVTACDDFIIVQDEAPCSASENISFSLSVAALKILETETRKVTDGEIEIEVTEDHIILLEADVESSEILSVWANLTSMVEKEYPPTESAQDFYLNPDRLKQIPRMKIQGDHPVGFRYATTNDNICVPFIYGDTVRGLITSMNEETLRARGVHLW